MRFLKLFIILLLCLNIYNFNAQIKTYVKTFKEAHTQQFFDMTKTFDNGAVFVGQQEVHGAAPVDGCDVLMMKVDSCGELLFYKSIGLQHKHSDGGRSVKEISNNNLLVAGFYMFGKETGSVTVFDSNGDYLWSRMYDGVHFFTEAIETSTGDILATGYTNDNKAVIFKFDNLGNLIWKKEIDNPVMSSRGYSVAEFSDGNYCFVWYSLNPTSDINVTALDLNGNTVWAKSFGLGPDIPIYREWEANAIVDPNDDNILITTSTTKLGNGEEMNPDILLFKLDNLGNIIWSTTYGNAGEDDQPKKLSFDTQKNEVLLSGKSNHTTVGISLIEPMAGDNALILRLDNNGGLLSTNVYGGSGSDKMSKVVAYDDYYLAAMDGLNSLGSSEFDPFILKLDTNLTTSCQNKTFIINSQTVTPPIVDINYNMIDYNGQRRIAAPSVGSMNGHFETICQSCEPYFEVIGDNTICPDDSILLVKKEGCTSFFTVNGAIESEDTLIFTYPEGGQYQITVEHECVEAPFQYDVFVSDPQASFNWEDKCLYDSIVFQDQSITNFGVINQWFWNFDDNNTTSLEQNPRHLYSADGAHQVSLIVSTDYGCTDTIENLITVHPVPQSIIITKNECVYDSVQFRDSTLINAPSNISSTNISYGDGSSLDYNLNPIHKYNSEGTYTVQYTTISNEGCVNDTSFDLEIYPKPIANFINTTVCENLPPTEFNNNSTVANGSIVQWQWDFDVNYNNSTSSFPNPNHTYITNGVYEVQLVVTTDNGCLDTITRSVSVLAKPTNLFVSNITESCNPLCVEFTDYTQSNIASSNSLLWQWNFSNGESSFEQNPSMCFYNTSNTADSSINVELITLNELGCYDSLYIEDYLWIWHNPISDFRVVPELVNMYESEVIFDNNSIGEDYYLWDFGDDIHDISFEPTHIYSDTGTFLIELIVETNHACFDTSHATVRVDPVTSLYMPNTFSPNGDGVNDTFFFKNYAFKEEGLVFRVFDKWGTLIYFTNEFIPWDGMYKGSIVKQDTYVWTLTCFDFFGVEHNYKGHVNLIK